MKMFHIRNTTAIPLTRKITQFTQIGTHVTQVVSYLVLETRKKYQTSHKRLSLFFRAPLNTCTVRDNTVTITAFVLPYEYIGQTQFVSTMIYFGDKIASVAIWLSI